MISRRRVLSIVVALPIVLTLACAATAAIGWVRAPGLVARERALARHPLRIAELPREHVEALLRVEDPTFFTHHGLDLSTPGAGMTTITQALVKFLYFDEFQPGWRKLPQSLFALGLDARVPKDDLLDLFLNRSYLGTVDGHEVRGFGEGAEAYFAKPAVELTREEWLALVAMCVGPDALSVTASPQRNHERVARIERLLAGSCRPADWLDVYYEECR